MQLMSRLEQESRLDRAVSAGQQAARLIRPRTLRDLPMARQRVPYRRRVSGSRAGDRAQPAFEAREAGGAIQVCLPGTG